MRGTIAVVFACERSARSLSAFRGLWIIGAVVHLIAWSSDRRERKTLFEDADVLSVAVVVLVGVAGPFEGRKSSAKVLDAERAATIRVGDAWDQRMNDLNHQSHRKDKQDEIKEGRDRL